MDSDPSIPTRTADKTSGLPDGTYFWRVKGNTAWPERWSPFALVNGAIVHCHWPRPAPATPSFTTPANNAQFHVTESFNIQWSPVVNAKFYILEADERLRFPIHSRSNLSRYPSARNPARYGEIRSPSFSRGRAVSVDGVRSLPSATRTVQITNAAPIPAGVSPVAPAGGATVQLPFFVDWTDTPNPQVPGYDLEFDASPNFSLGPMVLFGEPKPLRLHDHAGSARAGKLFLACPCTARRRGRSLVGWARNHGDGSCRPAERKFIAILAEPVNAYRWQYCAHARVMLDNPAPAGGAIVSLSDDIPQVNLPATTITVPAGRTDATISNIATGPVPNNGGGLVGIIGDFLAGFANHREQNSFGILPNSVRHKLP